MVASKVAEMEEIEEEVCVMAVKEEVEWIKEVKIDPDLVEVIEISMIDLNKIDSNLMIQTKDLEDALEMIEETIKKEIDLMIEDKEDTIDLDQEIMKEE